MPWVGSCKTPLPRSTSPSLNPSTFDRIHCCRYPCPRGVTRIIAVVVPILSYQSADAGLLCSDTSYLSNCSCCAATTSLDACSRAADTWIAIDHLIAHPLRVDRPARRTWLVQSEAWRASRPFLILRRSSLSQGFRRLVSRPRASCCRNGTRGPGRVPGESARFLNRHHRSPIKGMTSHTSLRTMSGTRWRVGANQWQPVE